MSRKKRKSPRKKHLEPKASTESKAEFSWPKFLKKFSFIACIVAILAVPAIAFMNKHDTEHDLSVVGNGTPTMVQIHDPGCPSCRRLKRNVNAVKAPFLEDIQFKIADIKTKEGSQFARKYDVPHVTLLFFDEKGRHRETLRGISHPDEIKRELERIKP